MTHDSETCTMSRISRAEDEVPFLNDNLAEKEHIADEHNRSSPWIRRSWPDRIAALTVFINVENIVKALYTTLMFLLPSFVTNRLTGSKRSSKASHNNSTAALDGLRGLACLFVYNEHMSYNFSHAFLYSYGIEGYSNFIQHPFIRIFWAGFSMVSIFFAISGYVLSLKSLNQIHVGDMAGFNKTITSSVIRRGFRLYMPTLAAIFMSALLAWLGAFHHSQEIWDTRPDLTLHEAPVPSSPFFTVQMVDAWRHAWQMLAIWSDSPDSPGDYDLHLWTIPIEFRTSMILFLVLIGIARLRFRWRTAAAVMIMLFSIYNGRREILLFIGGMFFADIDIMRGAHRKSSTTSSPSDTGGSSATPSLSSTILPLTTTATSSPEQKSQRWTSSVANPLPLPSTTTSNKPSSLRTELPWLLLLIVGLYFASAAVCGPGEQSGFQILNAISTTLFWPIEVGEFHRSIGALLITWSAVNSLWTRSLFTNRFALYLGQVSYAFYIVHGDVLKIVEYALLPRAYALLGKENAERCSTTQLGVVWAMCVLCTLPITLWAADLFWRVVDAPCVRFARWVEEKICRAVS